MKACSTKKLTLAEALDLARGYERNVENFNGLKKPTMEEHSQHNAINAIRGHITRNGNLTASGSYQANHKCTHSGRQPHSSMSEFLPEEQSATTAESSTTFRLPANNPRRCRASHNQKPDNNMSKDHINTLSEETEETVMVSKSQYADFVPFKNSLDLCCIGNEKPRENNSYKERPEVKVELLGNSITNQRS